MASPNARPVPSSEEGEPIDVKRGYSKRGDGFSVQETEGLLLEVRDRWQEGWDVIADVHNATFPGHKRTAGSLKRKFAKLYRTKIDSSTKEKHARAAALAKKVREEMRGQRRGLAGARALSEDLAADANGSMDVKMHEELNEVEMITSQPDTQAQPLPEAPSEHELRQTLGQSMTVVQETAMREDAWQTAINRLPIAGERLRSLRSQIDSNEPTSSPELVQTVLLVLLESQHQRDLERQQWQEEMREERRRHEQERAEDRRRNEQFMQVMTTLAAQIAAGQQRNGLN